MALFPLCPPVSWAATNSPRGHLVMARGVILVRLGGCLEGAALACTGAPPSLLEPDSG